MNDTDAAIVAAAEERDKAAAKAGWLRETAPDKLSAHGDRHELLRIVREQDTLLRERDTLAEDAADDAAATEATKGRWR